MNEIKCSRGAGEPVGPLCSKCGVELNYSGEIKDNLECFSCHKKATYPWREDEGDNSLIKQTDEIIEDINEMLKVMKDD